MYSCGRALARAPQSTASRIPGGDRRSHLLPASASQLVVATAWPVRWLWIFPEAPDQAATLKSLQERIHRSRSEVGFLAESETPDTVLGPGVHERGKNGKGRLGEPNARRGHGRQDSCSSDPMSRTTDSPPSNASIVASEGQSLADDRDWTADPRALADDWLTTHCRVRPYMDQGRHRPPPGLASSRPPGAGPPPLIVIRPHQAEDVPRRGASGASLQNGDNAKPVNPSYATQS